MKKAFLCLTLFLIATGCNAPQVNNTNIATQLDPFEGMPDLDCHTQLSEVMASRDLINNVNNYYKSEIFSSNSIVATGQARWHIMGSSGVAEKQPIDHSKARPFPGNSPLKQFTSCPYPSCSQSPSQLDDYAQTIYKDASVPSLTKITQAKAPYVYIRAISRSDLYLLSMKLNSCVKKFAPDKQADLDLTIDLSKNTDDSNYKIIKSNINDKTLEHCLVSYISGDPNPYLPKQISISVFPPRPANINPQDNWDKLNITNFTNYKVDAKIVGAYAKVSTEYVIQSTYPSIMDAEMELRLPNDAVITEYAVDINGTEETAVISTNNEQALRSMDRFPLNFKDSPEDSDKWRSKTFIHQKGKDAYRVKISQILPKKPLRYRIEYTTPLAQSPSGERYLVLPMPKNEVYHRDLTISAKNVSFPIVTGLDNKLFMATQGEYRMESHDKQVTSPENILITIPKLPRVVTNIEKSNSNYFFAVSVDLEEVAKADANAKQSMPENWRIFWDASLSRTKPAIAKAKAFIAELPENSSYELHVFRNVPEPAQKFTSRQELMRALEQVDYDGGSDLSPIVQLSRMEFNGKTLLFTDGIDSENVELEPFSHTTVMLSGAYNTHAWMKELSQGDLINLNRITPAEGLKQLLSPTIRVASLEGDNIYDVMRTDTPTDQRVTFLGRMDKPTDKALLTLTDGSQYIINFDVDQIDKDNTLSTQWAKRNFEYLSNRSFEHYNKLLSLGNYFNIITPFTEFKLLSSIREYQDFKIRPSQVSTKSQFYKPWLKYYEEDAKEFHENANNNSSEILCPLSFQQDSEIHTLTWFAETPYSFHKMLDHNLRTWKDRVNNWPQPVVNSTPSHDPHFVLNSPNPSQLPMYYLETKRYFDHYLENIGIYNKEENEEYQYTSENEAYRFIIEHEFFEIEKIPYINALEKITSPEEYYAEYLRQRNFYGYDWQFYVNTAFFFLRQNQRDLALRIVSNLPKLNPSFSMLFDYARFLRDAGDYKNAIRVFTRINNITELINTYEMLAKQEHSLEAAQKALDLYLTAIMSTNSNQRYIMGFNALAKWVKYEFFKDSVAQIPNLCNDFRSGLDADLRITINGMPDFDLHIIEPSTNEFATPAPITLNHPTSPTGSFVKYNFSPLEFEYINQRAPKGTYHIYGTNPYDHAIYDEIKATIFTNWGRHDQAEKTIIIRPTTNEPPHIEFSIE